MPKFYEYKSDDGGYIRTQINDRPQTLQLATSAKQLLHTLGYEPDDYIPRDVTKPLIILGVLKTKAGGLTKYELIDGIPQLSLDYCELDTDQQELLREYLATRVLDLSASDHELLNEFLSRESPLEPIQRKPGDELQTEEPETTTGIGRGVGENIDLTQIPHGLRRHEQWICWRTETRNGKPTKFPVSPHANEPASVSDSKTWASFDVAVDALDRPDVDGLGFVFTENDTIAGVDLDGVRDPSDGSLSETATEIVETLDSYTEVSPSGEGLHVLLHGFLPNGRQRHDGIELYDSKRFFTVTGSHLGERPGTIEVRHDELQDVHASHVAKDDDPTESSDTDETGPDKTGRANHPSETDLSEQKILDRGLKNDKFRRLWDGSTAGYQSHSEADMALCCLLAYYTGDDIDQMDTLFRKSGLMRAKWDEQRGKQTYGELTLQNAVAYVDKYDPYLHHEGTETAVSEIATLEPEQTATIEGTVETVEESSIDEIVQTGQLSDGTGTVRFVIWDSEYWGPETTFLSEQEYRLHDVWVTEYEGQREIQINEHTGIEQQD